MYAVCCIFALYTRHVAQSCEAASTRIAHNPCMRALSPRNQLLVIRKAGVLAPRGILVAVPCQEDVEDLKASKPATLGARAGSGDHARSTFGTKIIRCHYDLLLFFINLCDFLTMHHFVAV